MIEDGENGESVAKDSIVSSTVSLTLEPLKNKPSKIKKERKKLVSDLTRRKKTSTLPKRKKDQKSKISNRNPSIDTTRAKSSGDVVNLAIRELNWREYPVGRRTGCDLYWLGGSFDVPDPLPDHALLNKFPGMSEVAHKVELTRQLNRMKKLFPDEYAFYPRTWILPNEYADLISYVSKDSSGVYIVKPDLGSQGDGIFLMNNPYDVHFSPLLAKPCIVQKYIKNPLLLEKLKFDLRIYVILKSIDPLEIYICREGMARFCTETYQAPTTKNLHRNYMHLTNYSLNKHSSTYVQSDENDRGSKRKLSCVFNHLQKKGNDIGKLWSRIDAIICRTLIAFLPNLKIEEDIMVSSKDLKSKLKCFQILGFDILINEEMKPILLEVNSSPSLRIDHEEETSPGKVECFVSTTDVEIKLPIIIDTIKLAYYFKPRSDSILIKIPDQFGCLEQLYPKLSARFDHLRILERCLKLFRRFVGIRASSRMGPTSFRMMARRCQLTEFNYTLAAMDILFINISRRHSSCVNGRASLDFHAFVEILLAISNRRLSVQGRETIDTLRYIIRHCEMYLEKPRRSCRLQYIDRLPMSPLLSIRRSLKSSFNLPTSPTV